MSIEQVRSAYAGRADEYIAVLGSIDAAAEPNRQLITSWAAGSTGRIIDVGCGPGQWANHLHDAGADIEGVDPVAGFVDHAGRCYPDVSYRIARAEDLGMADASLGGILAWYSLIHTQPDRITTPFREFARCLRPDGSLLVGFVEGPELVAFDHAVTTAYRWPVDALAEVVERSGFVVTATHTRTDPGARPHGAIVARRA